MSILANSEISIFDAMQKVKKGKYVIPAFQRCICQHEIDPYQ